MPLAIPFDNAYARLPERFYVRMAPEPVAAPRLVKLNRPLADLMGLDADALESAEGVAMLAGNATPAGAAPLAAAYAGHQFGGWSPQLGDGRAILLGEVIGRDGVRRDIQLKGSGRTPFSRMGDGRAVLGPVLREYIVGEAMHALGVPTTRALAAVTTGEIVVRERPLPGAVLTRVAQSHIRVGTFQFFAARGDREAVKTLLDHAIARHYPEAADSPNPPLAFLEGVIARQAALIARWQALGFIHGVMNTDNMAISGETIDYGPCAFIDDHHPDRVFSSIDHGGRYAYANQPGIGQWNLVRLAQCLLPLIDEDDAKALDAAQAAIDGYIAAFETAWAAAFRAKLGLARAEEGDAALAADLLSRMAANGADFTLTFRRLRDASLSGPEDDAPLRALFADPAAFDAWADRWRARLARESDPAECRALMARANPVYIPRNHRVQEAIAAAEGAGDFAPFERLLAVLAEPFTPRDETAAYETPPRPEEVVRATFCGT
ncbi:MAG: YdiU family protein [Rhodobacteraceae bacterium]|nr:MAG: YdiU family protein [Paracoccaceae bacterium]